MTEHNKSIKGAASNIMLTFALVLAVTSASIYALNNIEKRIKLDVRQSIETVLKTTHEALSSWAAAEISFVSQLTTIAELRSHVAAQIAHLRQGDDLTSTADQIFLQNQFLPIAEGKQYRNIYIIEPDGSIIAASDRTLISRSNRLHLKGSDLSAIFSGKTTFILPSIDHVTTSPQEDYKDEYSRFIFIGAPVYDQAAEPIAALVVQIDPTEDFTRIIHIARAGETGDAYAFNRQAQVLTHIRFEDQLSKLKLIEEGQHEILHLSLRDPGGNLGAGHKSTAPRDELPLTKMASLALANQPGYDLEGYRDYRGVPVVGTWLWDNKLNIGLAYEVDKAEAFRTYYVIRKTVALTLSVTTFLFLVLSTTLISRQSMLIKSRELLEIRVRERTSELASANHELMAKDEHVSLLLSSTAEAIYGIDNAGNCTFVNASCLRLLGYDHEDELIGRNMHQLMHHSYADGTEYPEQECRIYQATRESRKIHVQDEVLWRKDGTNFWAEYWSYPMMEHAQAVGSVVTFLDITERKLAIDRLNWTQNNLMEAQRIAHLGSWEWDIAQDTLYWSDEVYRIFGLKPQEFGATYEAFMNSVHPDDRELVATSVNSAIEGNAYDIEHRVILPNGDERIVNERGEVSFGTSGEPLMMTGTVHDITEAKLAEQAIKEANRNLDYKVKERTAELSAKNLELTEALEAAKVADKAKDEFLANVSHELRTPLNGIIGLTQLMLDPALNGEQDVTLNREQSDNLKMVLSSAKNLLVIINDILDISRVAANKLELNISQFSLRKLFGDAINYFVHVSNEKGVSLLFNVEATLPDQILGDPVRLNQILINLLGNALKFTSLGTICVKADLDALTEKDIIIRFTVSDTGIGIPKDRQKAIFDAFVQADGSITRKHGGTGLGLSISNKLVKLMGGQFELSSDPGIGSSFTFTAKFGLPELSDAAGASLASDAGVARGGGYSTQTSMPTGRSLKILLAEDNPINQKLAIRLLNRAGHSATVADTGQVAINMLGQEDFDLILMDVMMPVMDGYDATRAIRSAEEGPDADGSHIPIIAMTASAMQGDREKCIEAGMDDYISKPVNSIKLMELINKYAPDK